MNLKNRNLIQNEQHLLFLDGYRGGAALWVVLSHSLILSGWSFPVVKRGDIAVDLFMIMSGFLMTYHFCNRETKEPWENPRTWLKFYLRRFFRIAPLYYLLLAIALFLGPQLYEYRTAIDDSYHSPRQAASRYQDQSLMNIFMHMSFLFGVFPKYCFSTPLPDWSIGLEMQFYLMFPFIVIILRRFFYVLPVILFSGTGYLLTQIFLAKDFSMPSFLPMKISLFLIGILLARAFYYHSKDKIKSLWMVIVSLILALSQQEILLVILTLSMILVAFYDRKDNIFKIGSLVGVLEKILSNNITKWMAEMSYSVYLLHLLIMIPIGSFLVKNSKYLNSSGSLRFLVLFLATVVPTYFLSWVLYHRVEKPGIVFGKNFIRKFYNYK